MIDNITDAVVDWPREGAWHADITHAGTPVSGVEQFTVGGKVFTGRVTESNQDGGRSYTHLVGTLGSMSGVLPDKNYSGGTALSQLVADIMRETGNTLSAASTSLSLPMTVYERLRGQSSVVLENLLAAAGLTWRSTEAGEVLIEAAPIWPDNAAPGTLVESKQFWDLYNTDVVAVSPGQAYQARRAELIRIEQSQNNLTIQICELSRAQRHPWIAAKTDVESVSLSSAKVVSQSSDGKLEVIVAGRYGVKNVVLRAPATPRLEEGSEVFVGYASGDRRAPYAILASAPKFRIGTILLIQQVPSMTVAATFFPSTPQGDTLLAAARAAAEVAVGLGTATFSELPLETERVDLRA